ncbi:unnamed protein product [Calypogeia fissa]
MDSRLDSDSSRLEGSASTEEVHVLQKQQKKQKKQKKKLMSGKDDGKKKKKKKRERKGSRIDEDADGNSFLEAGNVLKVRQNAMHGTNSRNVSNPNVEAFASTAPSQPPTPPVA